MSEVVFFSFVVKLGEAGNKVYYFLSEFDYMLSASPLKNLIVLSRATHDKFQEWLEDKSSEPFKIADNAYIVQNASYTEVDTIKIREYHGGKKRLGKAVA